MRSKSIDLFCASPASTAICSGMDHRSIHRPGLRPVHRPTHRRLGPRNEAPCLAQLPFDPSRPFYHNKSRKSTSSATKQANDHQTLRRKSSADVDDLANPLRSSGYLLSDKPYVDFILSDSERALVPSEPVRDRNSNNNNSNNDYKRLDTDGTFRAFRSLSTSSYESPVYKPSFANDGGANKNLPVKLSDHLSVHKSSSAPSNHQVVELRVSIHCKGCEGKLRKHISRMEGVTSFSIDLATKKVTVIGDVTPLSVLTSISRVKNAQFWPSPTSSSSSSSNSSSPSPRLSLAR